MGKEILGVSHWHEVTQLRIDQFAKVTGDHQWIHLDQERARRESPYATTIAHGFLTVSLPPDADTEAVETTGDVKPRVNYGFNRLRFSLKRRPVRLPRIRGRFTLSSIKDVEGGAEIVRLSTV